MGEVILQRVFRQCCLNSVMIFLNPVAKQVEQALRCCQLPVSLVTYMR